MEKLLGKKIKIQQQKKSRHGKRNLEKNRIKFLTLENAIFRQLKKNLNVRKKFETTNNNIPDTRTKTNLINSKAQNSRK